MLRRITACAAAPYVARAALQRRFVATATPVLYQQAAADAKPQGGQQRQGQQRQGQQGQRRMQRSAPGCEIHKRCDDDLEKGYKLKLQYAVSRDTVLVQYHKQVQKPTGAPGGSLFSQEPDSQLWLPMASATRCVGVLEGTLPSCKIASRMGEGTLTAGGEEHKCYHLKCACHQPGKMEKYEWEVELQGGGAMIMFHFLQQCIKKHQGF